MRKIIDGYARQILRSQGLDGVDPEWVKVKKATLHTSRVARFKTKEMNQNLQREEIHLAKGVYSEAKEFFRL